MDKLSVLMLSWEYPPRVIGGISPHIYFLSKHLAKQDIKAYVVTCDFPGAPAHEVIDDVEVYRVDSYKNPSPDFATWVYLMNMNMQRETATLIKKIDGKIDVIHAHDWLVANAGIGLKHIFRKPLLVTMHSTEMGRRDGLHTTAERMIHETEAWLTYEAWKVICCSDYMINHVKYVFGLPNDKLVMVPNGVSTHDYGADKDYQTFRSKFALPEEKIVLFVGRLVYEKGIHILINAVPKILSKVNAKFIIVGSGYMQEQLLNIVRSMGLEHKVLFEGFLDNTTLMKLQKCADVSVVPSLFEPFGIVALEAMAAGSPVVASDTGGLTEIVEHDSTGVKVYPNNPDSLAWGITKVLLDKTYAQSLRNNAYRQVQEKYDWEKIAQNTKRIYEEVLGEYSKSFWA
ncbi:glycosyltransferase family 4 protein [Candidatus Bathycorpusculum sp.]|uniref:glycosyltransferase family 4 protein n=1 Tax=Candidatus Bathycorpusculum sp. TaxID=2994959 RepID=UPI00282A765A|nr:glycosyltransferase family 4 protein [Candidatus Termitimicrobium sp.]MCL2431399.1 glycosyltransferase family 4 protein [Candidatus Termitimicrobium sp.]